MSQTNPPEASGPVWPPSEFTLVLRRPIQDDAGSEISSLLLHEPTDDEWVKILAHDTATRRRFLVSCIAGVPMGAVAKMAIGDVLQAENYCMAFFELGEATTPWSPPSSPTSTGGPQTSSEG